MKKNKTLLIIESPGKIAALSKYLGKEYIIKASFGHTHDIRSVGSNIGVDIENGFALKYKPLPNKKDTLNSIIDATSEANKIIIASDPDREGEMIAANLADSLFSAGLDIKRATFGEITKKAVEVGIQNLGEIDQNMVNAAKARRALDRICGYMASPFLIQAVGKGVSVGRVQSPTLKLLTQREDEIEAFKPDEYYNLSIFLSKLNDKDNNFQVKYVNKISNKSDAINLKKDLDSAKYFISSITQEEKKVKALPPLITSTLAAEAAGEYKFTPAKTMMLAQGLYESGVISYHRVDSVRMSDDIIKNCRTYLQEQSFDLPSSPNTYAVKDGSQDAHTAICPTSITQTPDKIYLSDDERKIYRLIWQRAVSSQMKPAIYDMAHISIKTENNHILKVSGKILKYKGWLEIISNSKDKDSKLPQLQNGEQLFLSYPVRIEQKATQPPPRYNDKTLIERLETLGIGRPATIAQILGKITDKGYAIKKNSVFIPTELGRKVIKELDKHFDFMQYKYTADMEIQLDLIAQGKLDYITAMTNFYTPFAAQLKKAYIDNIKDYGFICESCGGKMELKHGIFGFYMKCTEAPVCKNTFSCDIVDDKPIKRENKLVVADNIFCPKCEGQMCKKDGKFGQYYACVSPKCNGSRKVPFGKKCSDCGGELYATIHNGQNVLFCMNYSLNGCSHKEILIKKVLDPKSLKEQKININIKKVLNMSSK
jgi:DNA topoisomerase-1